MGRGNPEKRRAYEKRYREEHKERRTAQMKAWQAAHPVDREKRRRYEREYYAANHEKMKAKSIASSTAWRKAHPEEALEQSRMRAKRDRDQIMNNTLRSRYGITLARYRAVLAAQGGRCAICGGTDPGRRGAAFCVDHDHTNGRVRALLCVKCNAGIGMFRDNPNAMVAAAAYVRKHHRQHAVDDAVGNIVRAMVNGAIPEATA